MSDFGIFASRLQINNKSLRDFDETLRYLRKKPKNINEDQNVANIKKITSVLNPIIENLQGSLSKSMLINDQGIVEILHRRNIKNWQQYKDDLITLSKKLSIKNFEINTNEISILNDVANAMEIECSNLFKRMGRFP